MQQGPRDRKATRTLWHFSRALRHFSIILRDFEDDRVVSKNFKKDMKLFELCHCNQLLNSPHTTVIHAQDTSKYFYWNLVFPE